MYALINKGTTMIACGNMAQALDIFREALTVFLRGDFFQRLEMPRLGGSGCNSTLGIVPVSLSGSNRDSDMGYNKAFSLVGSKGRYTSDCDVALSLAVLHYNIASILQLQGTDGDKQEALAHYRHCLQVLTPLSSSQYSSCYARLAIATLLNSAVIQFDTGAFEIASMSICMAREMLQTALADRSFAADEETKQGLSFYGYLIPYSASFVQGTPAA